MTSVAYHQHDEERDGPDGASWKLQDHLRVGDEDQAWAGVDNILDGNILIGN